MRDDELTELRARVDCRTVLERAGWTLDQQESTRGAVKYRNGAGRIVIVTHESAKAVDIVVLCSNALESAVREVVPRYETATGDRVVITYASSAPLKAQIDGGAGFDVAILIPAMIADLVRTGKVVETSVKTLARADVGIAVPGGAPRPDISSVAATRAALLATPSLASSVAGQSRVGLLAALKTMGITDEVNAKTKIISVGSTAAAVMRGEAAMAVQLIPELMAVPGLDVIGPFPPELQHPVVLTAGTSVATASPGPSNDFIAYLMTPDVVRVLRAKGLQPG